MEDSELKATLSAQDISADVKWSVSVVPGTTLTGMPELSAKPPGTSGLTGQLLEPVLVGPVQKTERGESELAFKWRHTQ